MLEANVLSFAVGRKVLLEDVSLVLKPGELLAIVGPNGAGKSTLMRLLAGETTPRTGSIAIDGRPMAAWPKRDLARRRAVLPQSSSLSFPFSAGEVALMGRGPHSGGIERQVDRVIARRALEMAGVADLAAREGVGDMGNGFGRQVVQHDFGLVLQQQRDGVADRVEGGEGHGGFRWACRCAASAPAAVPRR